MSTYAHSYALICVLFVSAICFTFAADCGQVLNPNVPRFTQFALFPNPVQIGQTVYARAEVTLPAGVPQGAVTSGNITLIINHELLPTPISISNIPLCNSTSSIACNTLRTGPNSIVFEFEVPKIPVGTYNVMLTTLIDRARPPGCLQFDITVTDPTSTNIFTSWMEATLAGVAQFPVGGKMSVASDYEARRIGDAIQVGPIGPASAAQSKDNQWGSFINIVGSEDVIDPNFNPAGYVWGLEGILTKMHILSSQKMGSQTYEGTFYLGYVNNMEQRTLDSEIITGDFSLTWTFEYDSNGAVTSTLAGDIHFDDIAVLPTGWRAPITLGRLGRVSLYTNSQGNLVVNGTKKYCLTKEPCDFGQAGVAPNNGGLTDTDIAIMVALLVGLPLIAAMIGATLLYLRHRRRHEREEGIFSAARKPEYGNALVIDDIIQESREHGGGLIPALERRPGDSESDEDYSDDNEESALARSPISGRSSRRGGSSSKRGGRSRSRSLSPFSDEDDELRRSPAGPRRSRSMSGSDSDSDGGSSADRD